MWRSGDALKLFWTCMKADCACSYDFALQPHERLVISSPSTTSAKVRRRATWAAEWTPLPWVPDGQGGGSAVFEQPGFKSYAILTIELSGDARRVPFTWHVEGAPPQDK